MEPSLLEVSNSNNTSFKALNVAGKLSTIDDNSVRVFNQLKGEFYLHNLNFQKVNYLSTNPEL